MNVCTKAMKRIVGAVAAVAWLVVIASTLHRLAAGTTPHWCAAVTSLTVAVAVTATVVLTMQHTLPSLAEAWQRGAEYGRRVELRRQGEWTEVPAQRVRRLTPVR